MGRLLGCLSASLHQIALFQKPVPVTLSFTLVTLLPIGGTSSLSYPAGFFALSTPTEQPGSSSVAGFTGTCAAITSTSVVVNLANATVPASSFVITLSGFVMGGVTAGTVGVTRQRPLILLLLLQYLLEALPLK